MDKIELDKRAVEAARYAYMQATNNGQYCGVSTEDMETAIRAYISAAKSEPVAVRALPQTQKYVDRIIRIFRDHPADDTTAVVLLDYARSALASEPANG